MDGEKFPGSVNIKTLEGALCAEFSPPLTAEQNATLLHDTNQSHVVKMESVAGFVVSLSRSWGRTVILDPCPPYPPPRAEG